MNQTFISTIEKGLIAGAAALLGYLSQHATEFGPAYGPAVAAVAAVLIGLLNQRAGQPVVKALSLPKNK